MGLKLRCVRDNAPGTLNFGGHKMFCSDFSSLPEKSNIILFGNAFFSTHGGGGGGGVRRAALFDCQYGTPQRGRVWEGVSRGGGVLRFGSDGGVPLKPPNQY